MSTTTLDVDQAAPRPRIGFAIARWVLRITATVQLVLLVLQPIMIGRYLDGSYAMIKAHSDIATTLSLIALLFIGITIWYSVAGGRWWVLPFGVILALAIEAQVAMGYARQLGIHVPL